MLLPRSPGAQYLPAPFSLSPLPQIYRHGLIPLGVAGLVSVSSTLVLLIILTYRLCTSSVRDNTNRNQNILLIFNLLLADFQQSLSFVISFYWEWKDAIVAPHPACFAQGWLIQIGDISSGFWIMAIALHTLYTVAYGKRVPHGILLAIIVGIWIFAVVLTLISPAKFGYEAFVRAGAWCWIPEDRASYRLGLHYIWIFLAEFGTVLIYILAFVFLHRRLKSLAPLLNSSPTSNDDKASRTSRDPPRSAATARHGRSAQRVSRAARYMILYPVIYVFLTIPLAGGRMAQMAAGSDRQLLPDWYWIMAGTLMASCGWMDVIVYSLTRHVFASTSRQGDSRNRGTSLGMTFGGDGSRAHNIQETQGWKGLEGTTVQVTSGGRAGSRSDHMKTERSSNDRSQKSFRHWRRNPNTAIINEERPSTPSSTDRIFDGKGMRGVKAETTFEVRSETIELESQRPVSPSISGRKI